VAYGACTCAQNSNLSLASGSVCVVALHISLVLVTANNSRSVISRCESLQTQ
jgi:hypothetical protein